MSEKGLKFYDTSEITEEKVLGNIFFIKGFKKFSLGSLDNVDIKNENNNVVIKLSKKNNKYVKNGVFISNIINTENFTNLIVSWNAKTPNNTYIEVKARAYITYTDNHGKITKAWSEWLSWGKWGIEVDRASTNEKTKLANINTDIFKVVADDGRASKIQIKVKLYTEDINNTPVLRQITASFINTNSDEEIIKVFNEEADYDELYKVIETPCISQLLREVLIAEKICSPTSITMLLNRFGENLIVEEVAWDCFDYKYDGFGNWVFNVAFAGSLGYEAYVEYGNLESLKREINKGYPVAVSVKYTNDINNLQYPYIKNAPLTTSGHLIVVCGFEIDENGYEYVVVNDPAGKDNESVRLKYDIYEFVEAWATSNFVMYVVHPKY